MIRKTETKERTQKLEPSDAAGGDVNGTTVSEEHRDSSPSVTVRPSSPLPGPHPRDLKPRPHGTLPHTLMAAPLTGAKMPTGWHRAWRTRPGPGGKAVQPKGKRSPAAACRDTDERADARRARQPGTAGGGCTAADPVFTRCPGAADSGTVAWGCPALGELRVWNAQRPLPSTGSLCRTRKTFWN